MKIFFRIILSLSLAFSCLVPAMPAQAAGATLYLSPSSGTYVVGSRFSVAVRVNTGGEAINASQGSISFDKDILKVTGVSTGGSIFSLWTSQPTFNNGAGTVSFAGGVPHPGYTGSAGTICTISFQSLKTGTAGVRFTSGFALANDGKGTNILSTMGSGSYNISPRVEAPKTKKEPGDPAPKKEPQETAAYNKPEVSSETHPDENKWFSGDIAKFSWEIPDGVEGVSLSFDREEEDDPGPKADGLFDSKEYDIEEDGHWFLHIKFQDERGRWGTRTDFRINSDNTPPESFEIEVVQEENDWPVLRFETTDELSGIDRYEVIIDDLQADPTVVLSDNPYYKVENRSISEHTAIVKAYDRANNEALSTIDFSINPIATPEIKNYTDDISPRQEFFISGTAIPNVAISVYIEKEGESVEEHSARSDGEGNWFLVRDKGLKEGSYTAWVKAISDKGLESKESPRVNFTVSPRTMNKIGSFVADYFTLLVSLLFMVILIVISLLFLIDMVRKRLKKETLEIEEVLERNLSNTKKLVEMELNSTKMSRSDRDRLKGEIDRKIDEAKAGILKEVKDVEKILR